MVVVIVSRIIVFHKLNWAAGDFLSKLLQVEISELIDFEIRVAQVLLIQVCDKLYILLGISGISLGTHHRLRNSSHKSL